MSSLASNANTTENKLFIENYKILQASKEADSKLSHNYHTADLVTGKLTSVALNELLLALNIDRSGSMGTMAKDGHTALQHTIHTTKNIINYLEELWEENPELNLSLIINLFDDRNTMIGHYKIGQKDKTLRKQFIEKLEKATPRGSTNISGAFKEIKDNAIYAATPDDKKAHILMTDGRPNIGNTSAKGINENNPGGTQICLGYSTDHDAVLLQKMTELSKGSYHFVDSIENAGMVYGEIIHALLYAAVKDISVRVRGAEVYDFTTNSWSNTVKFNSFASEHTQSLIMRSTWDSVEPINFNIVYTETGNNVTHSKTEVFNSYNCTNGESKENGRNTDVEKQMFRQKALDGLWRAKNTENFEQKQKLKTELIELKKNMEAFMKQNKLEDDAFMQKLVTDVYVAYTGMESYNRAAFIGSRLTSQGRQQAYDISNFDGLTNTNGGDMLFNSAPRNLRRASMPCLPGSATRSLDLKGSLSKFVTDCSAPQMMAPPTMNLRQTSCYTTPTQADAMRTCSQQVPFDDEEDAN